MKAAFAERRLRATKPKMWNQDSDLPPASRVRRNLNGPASRFLKDGLNLLTSNLLCCFFSSFSLNRLNIHVSQ